MQFTRPEDWRPRGIDELEPAAWDALRHSGSACVVAGPGAGKTEFLAQKAAYLLDTGACPPPYRVLAISFKTDAATNLADRVRRRCKPELASRFVSLTFDAFTKSLVDRFLDAIPAAWRPTRPYEIAFPKRQQIDGFLNQTRFNAPEAWQHDIASFTAQIFEPEVVGSYRLPYGPISPQTGAEFAVDRWWRSQLPSSGTSKLTFVGLNRLAELLLRAHPHIKRALLNTYPFVFLDEFQDTTYAQYDFLTSAFGGTKAVVTAVGDDKQRIMVFAGARKDAFRQLEADFSAKRFPLVFNFRSSPDLVAIQHVVARALDPSALPAIAKTNRQVNGDVAQVWRSATKAAEACYLARWIAQDINLRGKSPRDYVILVKQKSEDYERELKSAFSQENLRMRNESRQVGKITLQDLLSDEICRIAISLFRLGTTRRAPIAWKVAYSSMLEIRAIGDGDDDGARRVEGELTRFLDELRKEMPLLTVSREAAVVLAEKVFTYLDMPSIMRSYPEYGQGDLLNIIIEAFCVHLMLSSDGAESWTNCIDAFDGVGQIPLMTVHKSKGLEYDTVLFVGLDDSAWWSHKPGDPEGLAAFFVALSRAKQRAIFAFCQQRGTRENIAELYELLTDAGVPEVEI
ncbi:ATP-dependent helicase [bacterium M00.F.Ca.ET.194.01.1.1]|nr:ATP-dependent helicase [bacterium M00.F.Ca.ET.194.01.1.1]TGS52515.1 ATP-dependent helicase [bacterium M00.F.Ca.ET.179.01.1.1]TGV44371.1 ATP-dependent helicase [bacterium M00.F.Ca.ET.168.01.1.1]